MRLIDADEMALNESEAYMSAQTKIENPITLGLNSVVHRKIQQLIEDTPTVDAVGVVRCKDCANLQKVGVCPMCYEEEISWDDDGYMEMDYVLHDQTEPDGFCHLGERGEGADNG